MGNRTFLILLPPSEGKSEGGDASTSWSPHTGTFGSTLGDFRAEIAAHLAAQKGGNAQLLGVSGKHLERAQHANRSVVGAPALPAWQRYTGVVWDHLDLASLTVTQRKTALARIVIPSGLAGLVTAADPLPDYRLKMGARLTPIGTVSKWWRDDLTEAFVEFLAGRIVIDLLPQEHRAAIDWTRIPSAVRVDLVSKKGDVVGGHNAKAAKGLLARHLLLSNVDTIAPMVKSFKHPEYSAKVTS
ncbi:MAG: hypothetical protein RIR69_1436 [Actinomycetota bacterium]|jgi:cytoplasmic iron level regulating protein YaaA (DUF328/UPF0246 family)